MLQRKISRLRLAVSFGEYQNELAKLSNEPLKLEGFTAPFGFYFESPADKHLLFGHLLDELAQNFQSDQPIDFIDVAEAAFELGHDPAGDLLDQAKSLLQSLVGHGVQGSGNDAPKSSTRLLV